MIKTKLELKIEFEAKLAFVIEKATQLAYTYATDGRESYLMCAKILKKTQQKIPLETWTNGELIAWIKVLDMILQDRKNSNKQI